MVPQGKAIPGSGSGHVGSKSARLFLAFADPQRHQAGGLPFQSVQAQREQLLEFPQPLGERVPMDKQFPARPRGLAVTVEVGSEGTEQMG
jgi:hypothetical protein